MNAERRFLPRRDGLSCWHFQHGPIDLVIVADGDAQALADAFEAAWRRFESVLCELVGELPALRRAVGAPSLHHAPRASTSATDRTGAM